MKTLSSLFVLCLLFGYPAFSQTKFGVKAGINATNVAIKNIPESNDAFNNKPRLSYHVGGFSEMPIHQKTSLLVELLYSNKGYTTESIDGIKAHSHFHYINLPVIFNYEVVKNVSLGIGPEFGYLLFSQLRSYKNSSDADFIYGSNFDLGIDANAEYKFLSFLKAGLRYNYGLTNVFSNDVSVTDGQGNVLDETPKLHNRVLQVYVGYIFN